MPTPGRGRTGPGSLVLDYRRAARVGDDSVVTGRFVHAARFVAVVALLWTIDRCSNLVMTHFHLPIPGFVLGFGLLYSAVATNALPYRWIEPSARFLVKHLAFFLVPIVTGLLDYLDVLQASGVQIAIVLIVSAIIGLWATGLTAQCLVSRGGADI
jgi:holin-like protein